MHVFLLGNVGKFLFHSSHPFCILPVLMVLAPYTLPEWTCCLGIRGDLINLCSAITLVESLFIVVIVQFIVVIVQFIVVIVQFIVVNFLLSLY